MAGCSRGPAVVATVGNIDIEGDAAFVAQVTSAMKLLEDRAPDAYSFVGTYIGRIEQNSRSGMWADADPPTLQLSDREAHYSVTWCAGSIVHDAVHSMQYRCALAEHGGDAPPDAWTGTAAERAAMQRQLEVLHVLGAPAAEASYLASLDGTYYDVDGDGQFTWSDYVARNW